MGRMRGGLRRVFWDQVVFLLWILGIFEEMELILLLKMLRGTGSCMIDSDLQHVYLVSICYHILAMSLGVCSKQFY